MPFALDASLTLPWCFADELSPHAVSVLRRLREDSALVPPSWQYEVGNAVWNALRRGRIGDGHRQRFVALLRGLPIEVDAVTLEHSLGSLVDLALAQRLTVYDAAYLDVALRRGVALATQDDDLVAAAGRLGVPLL